MIPSIASVSGAIRGLAYAAPAPRVVSVGTAVPDASYSQEEILDLYQVTDERLRGLFLNGFIERRSLTLPPATGGAAPRVESQGELLKKHVRVGVDIGRRAIEACLLRAGAEVEDIDFLCCVSTTGFISPGLSALLIKEMGLSVSCERLDVVGMGCNAGLNALNATSAWATANPGRLSVMVCIEVCSAAYTFDGTMRTAVVNSLFGDGAAALAVRAGGHTDGPALVRFSSHLIPDASDAMRYDWDDAQNRFSFYLDPAIPYVVGSEAECAVERLLADTGLVRSDITHWIVHSGGRKVIDAVRVNLGLTRYDLRHTMSVLRDRGNVSSGSFLFSYERLMNDKSVSDGDWGVFMTMGPGSAIELALVRWGP
jgi:polyketide synthase Type III